MSQSNNRAGGQHNSSQGSPILEFLSKPKRKRRHLQTDDISVCEFKLKGHSHAQYLIKVKLGSMVWSFWTRYSLLLSLHKAIDAEIPSDLPSFPEKRIFGNLDEPFLKKRLQNLNEYMKALFNDSNIRECHTFAKFISDSKKHAARTNDPESLHKFKLEE